MVPRSTLEKDRCLNTNGELMTSLEDLSNVQNEIKDPRENVQLQNECIRNVREQIRKFGERHKGVNEEIKQANDTIADLKTNSEENEKTREYLNKMVKYKSKECKKL